MTYVMQTQRIWGGRQYFFSFTESILLNPIAVLIYLQFNLTRDVKGY